MRILFLLKEWVRYPKMRGQLSTSLDGCSREELQDAVAAKRDALLRHAVETVPFFGINCELIILYTKLIWYE